VRTIERSSNVRVVTLDIGGNDILNNLCPGGSGASSCAYEANLRTILDALGSALARDPGVETLQVMEYYNPASGMSLGPIFDAIGLGADGRIDCTATGADRGLNDVIACVAVERGAQAIDPYATAKAIGPAFMGDSIHPSAAGHAAIACLFEHPERAGTAAPCRVLLLTGSRTQRGLSERALTVAVRTDSAATVTASARITIPGPATDVTPRPVTTALAARTRTTLEIPLNAKARRSVRRALRHHHRLPAAVAVTATDATGRSTDETRTFTLIK
jgi:hypothetical protein